MPERMEYSRFTLLDLTGVEIDRQPRVPVFHGATSHGRSVNVMDEPSAQAWYQDWFAGNDVEWTCWTNEVHIVLGGAAEITYWNPPTWEDTGTVQVRAGSIYLIPLGCKFHVCVTSEDPLRHVVVDFPNPGFPA